MQKHGIKGAPPGAIGNGDRAHNDSFEYTLKNLHRKSKYISFRQYLIR